jgi:carbonic anhydrase
MPGAHCSLDSSAMTEITSSDALVRLREGNQRFVSGIRGGAAITSVGRRAELEGGQHPYAIVLGCSDSRVPTEMVFDVGLGDLFVVRVAGNVAGSAQVASVEYAVAHLNVRLVVVLGHTGCGAVAAAIDAAADGGAHLTPSLKALVASIQPAIQTASSHADAVRANISATVLELAASSELLRAAQSDSGLSIVGAEYDLATGRIEFLGA